MSMTIAEARTTIKELFEKAAKIEDKYKKNPDEMPQEELDQVQTYLTDIDSLEQKLAALEGADRRRSRIIQGLEHYEAPASDAQPPWYQDSDEVPRGKLISPGEQFTKSDEYRSMKHNNKFDSPLGRLEFGVNMEDGTSLIEWKALLRGGADASGGYLVQNNRLPGFIENLYRDMDVMDLIPRIATSSDTIEFIRELAFTNAAAFVAEATATTGTTGLKPESALTFEQATAPVRTLAHWIPVTNRMLADAPAIQGIINSRLLLGLALVLESQLLTGDGTGENLLGILNTPGINIQSLGTDSVLDALYKARTQIRVTGRGTPGAVVIHPNDWEVIRLSRENSASGTLGNYLMGPPSQVGATTVWGIPVVETDAITENTALVGDFRMGATLFDREQAAIRVGTINDQFVRNMQTILAELRVAFVTWRPTMFTKVTGI